jgi:hypothetical protein
MKASELMDEKFNQYELSLVNSASNNALEKLTFTKQIVTRRRYNKQILKHEIK